MSRYERFGSRSLVYSKWHRYYLSNTEPMIDLDGVEYCNERGCNTPLVLIETARDVGQPTKHTTVLHRLAEKSSVLALCVLYKVSPEVNEMTGCACTPDAAPETCDHGIIQFRVRQVWPKPARQGWQVMTPEAFRDGLRRTRLDHIATMHKRWDAA